MRLRLLILVPVLPISLVILNSCGSTSSAPKLDDPQEIAAALAECQPKADTVRGTLNRIKDSLAYAVNEFGPSKPLDPLPVYLNHDIDSPLKELRNTAGLQYEALVDATASPPLNLYLKDPLLLALRHTQPGVPFPGYPIEIRSNCAKGFAMRYLFVIKTVSAVYPRELSGLSRFTPGTATLDVSLFDLSTGQILAGVRIVAGSSEEVTVKLGKYETIPQGVLVDDFTRNVRSAVSAGLSKKTGGDFRMGN
jgi:hypothetical protein